MVKIMPTSKTNSLYQKPNGSFRCITVIYKALQVILGLDFGFIKVKTFRLNVVLKLFTILYGFAVCICCCINLYFSVNLSMLIWFNTFFVEYLMLIVSLVLVKENSTVYNLIHDLRTIDSGLKIDPAMYGLDWKLMLGIFLTFVHRISLYILYCTYFGTCIIRVLDGCIVGSCILTCDIIILTYSFIFYAISCRMKRLVQLTKEEPVHILSKQYLYKSIVDIAEKHKQTFVPVCIIILLFNVPHVMSTMYITLREMQIDKRLHLTLVEYINVMSVLEMMALMLVPAICAGKITTQAERLKVILHDVLIQPQGDAEYEDVERFIGYVEARPCRLRVCKLIPLDADLISMVLHFCVTYLIVIIQFMSTS